MAHPVSQPYFAPFQLYVEPQGENDTTISGSFTFIDTGVDFDEDQEKLHTEDLVHGLLPLILKEGVVLESRIDKATIALADRYFTQKKFEKALEYYYIALQQAQNSKNELPTCYSRIAGTLQILKRFSESEEAYEKALSILREGKDTPAVAGCLENLGTLSYKTGKLPEAHTYYEEAKTLYSDESDVVFCLNSLARVSKEMNLLPKALDYLEEALAILEDLDRKDKTTQGLYLSTLGEKCDVLAHLGQHQKAIQCALPALQMLTPGCKKARFLLTLGRICNFSRDYQKAFSYYQETIEMLKSLEPSEKVKSLHALTLNSMTISLASLNRMDDAKSAHESACRLTNELFVPGVDPMAASSLDGLSLDIYTSSLHQFDEHYDCALQAAKALSTDSDNPLQAIIVQFQTGLRPIESNSCPISQLVEALHDLPLLSSSLYALKNFATYLRNAGFLHEAKQAISEALNFVEKLPDSEDCSDKADCLDILAEVLRDLGNYSEAKNALVEAIEIRRKQSLKDDKEMARLASSLDNMGNLLRELGFFREAREHIVEALVRREDLFAADHPAVILSLNSLGELLREIGEYDDALTQLQISYERVGANFYSLTNLGKLFLDLGDTDSAMHHFKMALHRAKNSPNPAATQERQHAYSLENVGHCLGYLGKYHDALEKQKQAYDERARYFGKDSYQAAASLCNIGMYLHRIGDFDKERALYEQALETQKKYFGKQHHVVANTLDNMGACYTKLEQYESALQAHTEALEIRKAVFGMGHPVIALSFDNLGFCHSHLGKPEEALSYFEEALVIRRRCFDENHPLIQLSQSYIDGCQSLPHVEEETGECRISKEQFEELATHALSHLESIEDLSTAKLEKNPTGFVRLRLPVPKSLADKIEMLRLNFWTSAVTIKTVEAPHNHPRYFESMIIQGGYTHNVFHETADSTSYVVNRIFKGSSDKRNILHAGKLSLSLKDTVQVSGGAMIPFPQSLIHQVLHTAGETMSINCVLKDDKNRSYYDVYLPRFSEQDPQIDRETLLSDETAGIALKMKEILSLWKDKTLTKA
jgi:tetratricopeptide (TPR) repeat protein